ncbi:anaphase-promoting complex subunit cdc27 [Orbilia brochopaga]|uniref:Anaphase-promoting complex subunit cdc27 n=1 Tax=Orbilia brochopaga TaxID=3140254 RepID=A0AAV9UFA8_9PEZI
MEPYDPKQRRPPRPPLFSTSANAVPAGAATAACDPSTLPAIQSQLRKVIWYSLDNNLVTNAIFSAERLVAFDSKDPDSTYLLALSLYRGNHVKHAESLTKGIKNHVGCAYIYAQCCLTLRKYRDGIAALEKCKNMWANESHWNQHSERERRGTPDAAAVFNVLGHLFMGLRDDKMAVQAYHASFQLNPYMWDSFSSAAETGAAIKASVVFKPTEEMLGAARLASSINSAATSMTEDGNNTQSHSTHANTQSDQDLFAPSSSQTSRNTEPVFGVPPAPQNRLNEGGASVGMETPTSDNSVPTLMDYTKAPPRKARPQSVIDAPRKTLMTRSRDPDHQLEKKRSIASADETKNSQSAATAPATRRSNRILASNRITSKFAAAGQREAKKPKTATKSASRSQLNAEKTSSALVHSQGDVHMAEARPIAVPPPRLQEPKEIVAHAVILDVYKKLGIALVNLCRFDCKSAVLSYQSLHPSQRDTPYVLAKLGRALYELSRYNEAGECFAKVRVMDPLRMQEMETYSTLLWHLKKDVELSFLAHELFDLDRVSPQAWCALGNCYSLQRDHDQALRCFRRATQIDDRLAYAYTLQGHEHLSNDDLEKAMSCFRSALSADGRHYNAWYGIGKVYEKSGKNDMALRHYKTAYSINPTNVVLICCVGAAFEKEGNYKQALVHYSKACDLAPNSALSKFRKARVLIGLGKLHMARDELVSIKDIAPDEANVHFMLARVYKLLHEKQLAIKHFTSALHLDPRASALIKEAMESLDDPNEDSYIEDAEPYLEQ